MLPLDLHVLSLPLAFILSQDQTLHCIISYIILSLPLTLIILPKELTLLDKLFFSVLASCTIEQSFQWTFQTLSRGPVFRTGLQRYALFFNFQIFLQKFFNFHFSASVLVRTLSLAGHPFFKGSAKVRLFYLLPNFFAPFWHLFWKKNQPGNATGWLSGLYTTYNFEG